MKILKLSDNIISAYNICRNRYVFYSDNKKPITQGQMMCPLLLLTQLLQKLIFLPSHSRT